jgi:hypothetical protein
MLRNMVENIELSGEEKAGQLTIRYQITDEGLVILNADGTKREELASEVESAEIANQIAGSDPSSGAPMYRIEMLSPEDEPPSIVDSAEPPKPSLAEIRAQRIATAKGLTERFGRRAQVEGTRAGAWYDPYGDSVWVVRADGNAVQISHGGIFNFGNRENPVRKKWLGKDGGGWGDISPAEIIRDDSTRRHNKRASLTEKQIRDMAERITPMSEPEDAELARRRLARERMRMPEEPADPVLDPDKFAPTTLDYVSDGVVTKTEGFRHPDAVGKFFTQEQMEAEKSRTKKDPDQIQMSDDGSTQESLAKTIYSAIPNNINQQNINQPKKRVLGSASQEAKSGPIFEAGKGRTERTAQSWDIDPARYIGVRPDSLKTILANPDREQLFGELLHTLIPDRADELSARMKEGVVDEKEGKIILYAQWELARRLKDAHDVGTKITASDVELMIQRDESFHQMTMLHGVPAMVETLKAELPHMAMRDDASVSDLVQVYKDLSDERKTLRYKFWDFKARRLCSRGEIDPHDFSALRTQEGRDAMEIKLAEQYRNEAGLFRKAVSWSVGWSKHGQDRGSDAILWPLRQLNFTGRAQMNMRKAEGLHAQSMPIKERWWLPEFIRKNIPRGPTNWILRDVDENIGAITRVMSATVSDDTLRRKLMIEAVHGNKLQMPRENGPRSFMDMQQERQKFTPQKFQEWFDRDIAQAKRIGALSNDPSEEELTEFRDNAWNPQEIQNAQEQSGEGFWASVLRALLGSFSKEQKKKVRIKQ